MLPRCHRQGSPWQEFEGGWGCALLAISSGDVRCARQEEYRKKNFVLLQGKRAEEQALAGRCRSFRPPTLERICGPFLNIRCNSALWCAALTDSQ